MHEWEQQLNHAGQRPIRSLSLFLSLLSPSASSRLYTTARLPSTSHQAYTSTKSLARPNGFYNGRKRMGEATKRSNWTTTCNVCRRSSLRRLLALHLPRVRSNECSPLPLFPVHIAVFIILFIPRPRKRIISAKRIVHRRFLKIFDSQYCTCCSPTCFFLERRGK